MGCAVEVEDDPFEVEVSKEMGLPAPPPLDVFLIVCGGGKTVQLKVLTIFLFFSFLFPVLSLVLVSPVLSTL